MGWRQEDQGALLLTSPLQVQRECLSQGGGGKAEKYRTGDAVSFSGTLMLATTYAQHNLDDYTHVPHSHIHKTIVKVPDYPEHSHINMRKGKQHLSF